MKNPDKNIKNHAEKITDFEQPNPERGLFMEIQK